MHDIYAQWIFSFNQVACHLVNVIQFEVWLNLSTQRVITHTHSCKSPWFPVHDLKKFKKSSIQRGATIECKSVCVQLTGPSTLTS